LKRHAGPQHRRKIERLDLAGWLKLYTPDKNTKPLANFLPFRQVEVARIDYLDCRFSMWRWIWRRAMRVGGSESADRM